MNTFKTQEELYKALLEGKTIIFINSNNKQKVKIINGFQHSYLNSTGEWKKDVYNFARPSDWELYEPKRWFENLGEGVLCWVWDDSVKNKILRIVFEYTPEALYHFRVRKDFEGWIGYKNAEPVKSLEELEKYIWKDEDE